MGRPPKTKREAGEEGDSPEGDDNSEGNDSGPAVGANISNGKKKKQDNGKKQTSPKVQDVRKPVSSSGSGAQKSSGSESYAQKRQKLSLDTNQGAALHPLPASPAGPHPGAVYWTASGASNSQSNNLPVSGYDHKPFVPQVPGGYYNSTWPSSGFGSNTLQSPQPSFPHSRASAPSSAGHLPQASGTAFSANPYSGMPPSGPAGGSSTAHTFDSLIGLYKVQTEHDIYSSFSTQPLSALVTSFYTLFESQPTQPPNIGLQDPTISPLARIRALHGKAVSIRRSRQSMSGFEQQKERTATMRYATPEYARSLVQPLWDGLPVDIISLVTTGRPSASGPFGLKSGGADGTGRGQTSDEYLFGKLLREDESVPFACSARFKEIPTTSAGASRNNSISSKDSRSPKAKTEGGSPSSSSNSTPSLGNSTNSSSSASTPHTSENPYKQYAPNKSVVLQYFQGFFGRHPIAPLIINEKLFVDDLMADRQDDLLINVIVGSAIARAPCLTPGGSDAVEVGDYFFNHVEKQILSRLVCNALSIETCQAIILWATHEIAHMRMRRAKSLLSTADALLRERLRRFQIDAAKKRNGANAENPSEHEATLGWREIVEQELTTNALWFIVVLNTWGSLSLRLPHASMSIFTASLPLPPSNVTLSSSFTYSYSAINPAYASAGNAHLARRVIERFSDTSQLINVLVTIKHQAQAKSLFAPDPPRPLAVVNQDNSMLGGQLDSGNDANIARWLLDIAKYLDRTELNRRSSGNVLGLIDGGNSDGQLINSGGNVDGHGNNLSDSSRAFLVVAHTILALHQLLPYTAASYTNRPQSGSPSPLPTVDSLRTALQALQLLSASITFSPSPASRTRTQALLLDSLPRIIGLLELFTSTSLTSLDHFVLITDNRDLISDFLRRLRAASESFLGLGHSEDAGGSGYANPDQAQADTNSAMMGVSLNRAGAALQAIAEIGRGVQEQQQQQQQIQEEQHRQEERQKRLELERRVRELQEQQQRLVQQRQEQLVQEKRRQDQERSDQERREQQQQMLLQQEQHEQYMQQQETEQQRQTTLNHQQAEQRQQALDYLDFQQPQTTSLSAPTSYHASPTTTGENQILEQAEPDAAATVADITSVAPSQDDINLLEFDDPFAAFITAGSRQALFWDSGNTNLDFTSTSAPLDSDIALQQLAQNNNEDQAEERFQGHTYSAQRGTAQTSDNAAVSTYQSEAPSNQTQEQQEQPKNQPSLLEPPSQDISLSEWDDPFAAFIIAGSRQALLWGEGDTMDSYLQSLS